MTAISYLVDFDGTLADTSEANYMAYANALLEVGVNCSRQQFREEAFGRNWRQFLPLLLRKHGSDADPAAIAARKAKLYRDAASQIHFNEALILLLKTRSTDSKSALVTSASAINVQSALSSRPEILKLFDTVVTGDDVTRHKPDPQGFEIAAERLGITPASCIIFEDSDIGVAAAVAFGAPVLRISMVAP